jgi:hypothetical protein
LQKQALLIFLMVQGFIATANWWFGNVAGSMNKWKRWLSFNNENLSTCGEDCIYARVAILIIISVRLLLEEIGHSSCWQTWHRRNSLFLASGYLVTWLQATSVDFST